MTAAVGRAGLQFQDLFRCGVLTPRSHAIQAMEFPVLSFTSFALRGEATSRREATGYNRWRDRLLIDPTLN